MLRYLALCAIRFYQRHLSPKKGFGCAYRIVYGGCGCSGVGYRLIRRYGVFSGCRLLRLRLARCRFAYVHYCAAAKPSAPALKRVNGMAYYQRGDCVDACPCDTRSSRACNTLNHYANACPCDLLDACDARDCGRKDDEGSEPKRKPIRMPNLR